MNCLHTLICALFLLTTNILHAQDCNNDITPPTPILVNGPVFSLEDDESIRVSAKVFDKASFDDCSSNLQIKGQLFGGPLLDSIDVSGSLGGIVVINIWIGDESGNWTSASTYFQIRSCTLEGPHTLGIRREIDIMVDPAEDSIIVTPDLLLSYPDTLICGGNYLYLMFLLEGDYIYDGSPVPGYSSIGFQNYELGTHIVTLWSGTPSTLINFQTYINILDENGEAVSCDQDTVAPIISREYTGNAIGFNVGVDSLIISASDLNYFAVDNCDLDEDLRYRVIRYTDADGNVPSTDSLVVYPDDDQTVYIQLWVGDQSDNWTVHNTYVLIQQLDDYSGISFVGGNAFYDLDENCMLDTTDSFIPGLAVQASFYQNGQIVGDSNNVFYTNTLGNGYYDFMLEFSNDSLISVDGVPFVVADTNGLEMQLVTPLIINSNCPSLLNLPIGEVVDTFLFNNNFAVQLQPGCHAMYVDIGTSFLRRCIGTSNYHINYANYGAEIAEDAYVEITFDSLLNIEGSSIPWTTVSGQTYTFPLGNVLPGEGGHFSVEVSVSCDAVLGQTHCTSAHIFPDEPCGATYNGASVEVEGWCDEVEGLVNFLIRNAGTADMQEMKHYIVVEDVIMLEENPFDLIAGQETMFDFPANGSTYRLEAEQVDGHPGLSMPSIAIEGCGTNGDGTFSIGFVNLYPQDELNPYISIDCQSNVGSYDPNDKQGFPLGVGEEHFISANGQIDYRIRFQNTGTDTAFTVVILDTLSEFLDISSIRPGASSHDYTFQLLEDRVLEFRFDNILLPDSTTNLDASQGFVQFTIMQVQDNPVGTVIENDAAIYFDLNEPIITNTTFHQIGDVVVIIDGTDEPPFSRSSLKVYPNPFSGYTTFELSKATAGVFKLHSTDGRIILQQAFNADHIELYTSQLPGAGLYFFEIITDTGERYSGKLIAK